MVDGALPGVRVRASVVGVEEVVCPRVLGCRERRKT